MNANKYYLLTHRTPFVYNKVPYLCFCAEMSNNEENRKKPKFYMG